VQRDRRFHQIRVGNAHEQKVGVSLAVVFCETGNDIYQDIAACHGIMKTIDR